MRTGAKALFALTALAVSTSAQGALITSVTATNGDAAVANTGGRIAQRENEIAGTITPFGEDVFGYLDRTHQWNGARFNAAGTPTGTVTPGTDVIVPIPGYLLGGEYVSTNNTHRDNPNFQMQVVVGPAVKAYLLIDNRVGDNTASNPASPAAVANNAMAWVAADGWSIVNTGISPNNATGAQPDFIALDEGDSITDFTLRTPNATNQGTGAGVLVNSFFTVFTKDFGAGSTITLGPQNDGTSRTMYGLVVTEVPEPSALAALAGVAILGIARRRRS